MSMTYFKEKRDLYNAIVLLHKCLRDMNDINTCVMKG
jgi:hypothetical protein